MLIPAQKLIFNRKLSQQRINRACSFFGEYIIKHFITFGLYLLGTKRSIIASFLATPLESINTIIKVIQRDGLSALEDRRANNYKNFGNIPTSSPHTVQVSHDQEKVIIDLGHNLFINIPCANKLQLRITLLSFLNSGLLDSKTVADTLNLSQTHTNILAQKLQTADAEQLIDHRNGQQSDYVFTDKMKLELIQQFVVHTLTEDSTSSGNLTQQLNARLDCNLSERTVQCHIQQLGLNTIVDSLPQLLNDRKKKFKQ
jgi:hypothetical protein